MPFIHLLVPRKAHAAKMSTNAKLDLQDKKMDTNKQELDKKMDALTEMIKLLLARPKSIQQQDLCNGALLCIWGLQTEFYYVYELWLMQVF